MDFKQSNKLLTHTDQQIFSNIKFDSFLEKFTKDINAIYASHSNLMEDASLTEIIKIPWIFCKIYSTQQKNNYMWAKSSYDLFARSCKRLFEFTLHIHSLENECLSETYLSYDYNNYTDLVDYYYREIDTLSHHGFNIIKSHSKNHVHFEDNICKVLIKYAPKNTVQVPKKLQNLFKKFLLITPNVIRIYNSDDSKNTIRERHSKGQWGKRAEFETDETDFSDALIEKKRDYHSIESKLEDIGKAKFSSSPILNGAAKELLGFQPVSENNTFKRAKIARAISSNIAKQNQKLISEYTIPEASLFSTFIKQKIIKDAMSFENTLFLSSFLLAINHIELLKAMMGIHNKIKIDLKKHTLAIQLNSSIFAQQNKTLNIYTERIKS